VIDAIVALYDACLAAEIQGGSAGDLELLTMNLTLVGTSRCDISACAIAGGIVAP